MGKKREINQNLPINKFFNKTVEFTIVKLMAMTTWTYWKFYHLTVGRQPTLYTAVVMQYLTHGEVKCEDLLTQKDVKEFKKLKKLVEEKNLQEQCEKIA